MYNARSWEIRGLLAVMAVFATVCGAARGQPANDRCADGTEIPGNSIDYTSPSINTAGAETETCADGDVRESCGYPKGNSNSVWFSYKPNCSGSINVNTFGSDYDTVLSIFAGCGQENPFCIMPTELGCNDDSGGGLQSALSGIAVMKGETYRLKVADYNLDPGGGSLRLNLSFVPSRGRRGKISRNVYRIPYANAMTGRQGRNDYVDHCGAFDTFARTPVCTNDITQACTSDAECSGGICDYVVVAPADGIVCSVIEHFDDCGSSGAYGSFGNGVVILHANGERSAFLHFKQWSASLFGIEPGLPVTAGQPIAIEGDVGRTETPDTSVTECGTNGPPRAGTCLESVPGDAEGSNCFRHIHWAITRYGSSELVQPYTCGISGNIYEPNTVLTPVDCAATSCGSPLALSDRDFSGYGTFEVFQGRSEYTASTVRVANNASVVLHACDRVRLTPGFRAAPGGYFRAEIGLPNRTAPSNWAGPASCPCTDAAWGICVQRSDPTEPDRVAQLCSPPGPVLSGCHGCSIGGRCCDCDMAGTCEDIGSCE